MRRIAIFSDIHGNLLALEAVLSDIDAEGIAERICLGDLVGYGPDPAGVIDAVRDLGIPVILGNYDDGVGNRRGECGCYYATEQARSDGAASYDFTSAHVNDADARWLAGLQREHRVVEGDARVLFVHGSPRKLNEYLLPDRTDAQLVRLAAAAGADVVCVGHVHVPYHRDIVVEGAHVHYVSSGSVGKPKDGDVRACWVELVLGTRSEVIAYCDDAAAAPAGTSDVWVGVVVHRVEYAVSDVADAMREARLPETLVVALLGA
ncbi:MAG: metallophosphoesterase [Coriobacteriia bacterium]|nr:metallophosphoesterase [Coriobacteriia bacterium]MBN2821760.1 metallophosphoesterase [Coriobacteriia bacterium]